MSTNCGKLAFTCISMGSNRCFDANRSGFCSTHQPTHQKMHAAFDEHDDHWALLGRYVFDGDHEKCTNIVRHKSCHIQCLLLRISSTTVLSCTFFYKSFIFLHSFIFEINNNNNNHNKKYQLKEKVNSFKAIFCTEIRFRALIWLVVFTLGHTTAFWKDWMLGTFFFLFLSNKTGRQNQFTRKKKHKHTHTHTAKSNNWHVKSSLSQWKRTKENIKI